MKLTDILNERKEIPAEDKIGIQTLKEYIFKDWQTFNQKVVPSFKHLRSQVMKENYSNRGAKNNIMSIVEFAAKKYIAEMTVRKYLWNEMFPKNERIELAGQLVEFFERYNLTEDAQLLSEQGDAPREAKITFGEIEVEIEDNQPRVVLNFNFDEETTNYITNVLAKNQGLKLAEGDFHLIQDSIKVSLVDVSSGHRMSYLKFGVKGSSISRVDLKHLTGGAFLNRSVTLEIIGNDEGAPEGEEDFGAEPEVNAEPKQSILPTRPSPKVTNQEIREAVQQSIKHIMGE